MSGTNIVASILELANSFISLGVDHGKVKRLTELVKVLDETLVNNEKVIDSYRADIKKLKERLNED